MTLATIAHPSIPIDDRCLAVADKILAWMCSNANMPALSRKSDLLQLRAAATRINSAYRASSAPARLPIHHAHNWLWDALDIDRETAARQGGSAPSTSILRMEPDENITDAMLEDEWLWAGTDLQDLAGQTAF